MDDKKLRKLAHELLRPKDLRGPGLDIIMRNQHEKTFGVRYKNPPKACEDCEETVQNRVIIYRRPDRAESNWQKVCNICLKTWPVDNPNTK